MRDRVASTRSLVTVSFVALFMVTSAGAAFAQDGATAVPFNFVGGPLGIAVAALGLAGVVLGFWRFFRKSAKAKASPAATPAAQPQAPEPAPQPANS